MRVELDQAKVVRNAAVIPRPSFEHLLRVFEGLELGDNPSVSIVDDENSHLKPLPEGRHLSPLPTSRSSVVRVCAKLEIAEPPWFEGQCVRDRVALNRPKSEHDAFKPDRVVGLAGSECPKCARYLSAGETVDAQRSMSYGSPSGLPRERHRRAAGDGRPDKGVMG